MLQFHQKELCEGIIQHLEARARKTRRDVCERDKGNHVASSDARVEMTFWLGARTILVLEHNDVQTTNVLVVADAYLGVITPADAPDETYMVSTYSSPWYAWPILIDGRSYFNLAPQSHFCIDANGHLINRK